MLAEPQDRFSLTRAALIARRAKRQALLSILLLGCCAALPLWAAPLRVATFRCNITPPLGQPLVSCDRLRQVEQPLLAKGIVLEAGHQRYVLCALDWCELNNGSHDTFCIQLAAAAGTVAAHVAVQTVHQHTAPLVDSDAQKILAAAGAPELMLTPQVVDLIARRLAQAVKDSLGRLQPFDRVGTGQAKVDRVAATRRPVDAHGKVVVRYSACTDAAIRALPEGRIDPYLKTITLARGAKPLVRLHYYATHPQSNYGDGRASSDVVGDAREALERQEGVFEIYFDGCGGDITMGKYNDGSRKCRVELAKRLLAGMEASVAATKFTPVGEVVWRTYQLRLAPRDDAGFKPQQCLAVANNPKAKPVTRIDAGASRLAFQRRSQRPIELSALRFGNVEILNLPGEPMVAFQFFAQREKPGAFVAVAGYGDCGPGYLCTARAFEEGGYEPTDSYVKPECELLLKQAITTLLADK